MNLTWVYRQPIIRRVAKLVEDHEVAPGEMVGDAARLAGACLPAFEHRSDDVFVTNSSF